MAVKKAAVFCFPFAFAGFFVPLIKFRLPQEKVDTFTPDISLKGIACSTDKRISPFNIGLLGTLRHGISFQTTERMLKHKARVLSGIMKLAFCAAVACYALTSLAFLFAAHKTAVVAGAFFAVF